ncbi:hypothetical protein ARAM_000024 [Aspergillus rambellii]|uniref:Uncharacterized protein n=1 Tax=Aspergillus rambellii TaxID=308745 RepID=A0A0F8XU92_9EURO|nr:hypothetical protein ARAM_000024 [Aspergillus rambellii]
MAPPSESVPATIPCHIPPFARPLAPYLKSRQEALRIRQVLTSYLRSHIAFVDNDASHPGCHAQSHVSLCVPDDTVVEIKRIPAELTGLRKAYLQALQANVTARKQQQLILEKTARASEGATGAGISAPNASLELQAYLKLVRERRRHAKLRVFQHYLQEFKERDPVRPEDFEDQEGRNQFTIPEEFADESPNGSRVEGGIGELMHKLERAVIRAKTQLDRERKLYEELKSRNGSGGGNRAEEVAPAVKIAVLQRTRDELVQWVEEKLVGGGTGEEAPVPDLPAEEIEESVRILEEQKGRIMEQYAAYTDSRKRLLDAASRACQPISTASTKPPSRTPDPGISTVEATLPIEPLEVLSFASDVLHPLAKSQRSLALQKFYLSALLAKEKSTTLRILHRLSDESHLLPEYPILARQPRFKHAAAALGSRPTANEGESTKPDEIVRMAEAWSFASEAAGSAEKEYVEVKVAEGSDRTEEAQHLMERVYDTLNQDLEETLEDEQENKPERDIWAYEAQSTRSRGRANRGEKRSKGPWTRLNGRVGLTDQKTA